MKILSIVFKKLFSKIKTLLNQNQLWLFLFYITKVVASIILMALKHISFDENIDLSLLYIHTHTKRILAIQLEKFLCRRQKKHKKKAFNHYHWINCVNQP